MGRLAGFAGGQVVLVASLLCPVGFCPVSLLRFQQRVGAIGFGNILPTALSVFRLGAGGRFGPELDRMIEQLLARYEVGPDFNGLKFRTDELKVSFLCYHRQKIFRGD